MAETDLGGHDGDALLRGGHCLAVVLSSSSHEDLGHRFSER